MLYKYTSSEKLKESWRPKRKYNKEKGIWKYAKGPIVLKAGKIADKKKLNKWIRL